MFDGLRSSASQKRIGTPEVWIRRPGTTIVNILLREFRLDTLEQNARGIAEPKEKRPNRFAR